MTGWTWPRTYRIPSCRPSRGNSSTSQGILHTFDMEPFVFSEQNWFRPRQVAHSGINQNGWNMRHEPFEIRYFLLKMVILVLHRLCMIMLGYQDICPSERCWNLVLTLPKGRCVRKTSPLPARRRNNHVLTYVCYHFMTSVTLEAIF